MLNELDKVIIDTEKKLLDTINNSGLPCTVLSMIVQGLLQNINQAKFNIIKEYNELPIKEE